MKDWRVVVMSRGERRPSTTTLRYSNRFDSTVRTITPALLPSSAD